MDGREDIMSKPFTDVDMIFIPVNLGGDHWVLARAALRAKRVRIYDSLVTFCNDKIYLQCQPLKVRIVKDVPQQESGSGDCGVFMLMFTMHLMFGLKLDFDSSHGHYFRKKIVVDIFTGNIAFYK
ncbi:hypothetical protein CUMW_202330 [Citrus unshiu]|uniref:Ubiquitin-like protease family profile domain-containing protein n=1 Tax=Citrus unshiu TaxID=55188 RepID=A0A2H5Q774_CITUN|nr:hypothetical protein CUMW_202330 [Citrus unshiu]